MLDYIGTLILGIYIGQEFGHMIPNVRLLSLKVLEHIKDSSNANNQNKN